MASPARRKDADPAPDLGPVAVDNRTHHIKMFWTRDLPSGEFEAPKTRRQGHNRPHRVLPGLNDSIPRNVWDLMLKNVGWKGWIESNTLHVLTKPPTEWNEHDALDLISRSADIMSMRRWRKLEKRKVISDALGKKIVDMTQMATGKAEPDEGAALGLV